MRNNAHRDESQPRRRVTNQRNFEIDLHLDTKKSLDYFVGQELGYYNRLIEQLTPRLRAFPQDILSMKDKEKRLWEACAEHAIDPQKLIDNPFETWPSHLSHMHSMLYDTDGNIRISPSHVSITGIASTPARLHSSVRKAIAVEVLKYMVNQADTLLAAMKTESLRSPMQMLQTHTLDSKRHLQIPHNLVKITYDENSQSSLISIPYSKNPLSVLGFDLSEVSFKMLVIRAPHQMSSEQRWQVELKDGNSGYALNMTDPVMRRKR